MNAPQVVAGAEPMSHDGDADVGLLVLHGFTGNPSSMRLQAEALAAAGYHVELPRLPGHGTTVEEMIATGWADWSGEALAAYDRLAGRCERIVVAGLSMGGSLTLWTALERPDTVGIICVNPATVPQPPDVMAMLDEMLADGVSVVPGIGSDIADPEAVESAYDGTPVKPLISFQLDGLVPMTARFAELTAPLLLITSRQDHVVDPSDSEHLAATHGGTVEHVWLDRSYHVATQDYDRDEITTLMLGFVEQVAGG